jgi:hypothetical protein
MFRFSLFLVVCALALPPALAGGDNTPLQGKFPFKKKALGEKKEGLFDWIVGKLKGKADGLRKYEDVITKEAKTQEGVFKVHRIEDRLFFEIPKERLGKLMLWTAEIARAPAGVGWGGKFAGSRVIRFDRRGNKIFLWLVSFQKRADGKAVERAVESANQPSIVMSFPVETEGKDKNPVIQVTSMFTSDPGEFSVRNVVSGASGVDPSLSYLDSVKAFPTNIETRSLLTFRTGGGMPLGAGPLPKGPRGGGFGGSSASVLVHYSLALLPERPMVGRYFDPRVGYFTRAFEDYGSHSKGMVRRQYITRFRLEKRDLGAAVSEPVKPIIFYLSREVPEKWRPYLKQGVEDWRPALEKAGFKDAILCLDAPTVEQDPTWDPEDARWSVIRWVAEPTQNAMGPHVHDPRSGEVISAHIIFWNDVVKLVTQWYFVQCAAVDKRAQKLPLPDDIIGECLRYVAAHEVGHTLGLRHNHRGSSAYTVEQLRDPNFTAKYGTVGSIMAYGRFNYVAQPGDGVKQRLPVIGPYDQFAIEWGYRSIPGAKSPEEERPTLDKWAARQLDEPWLRFGGEDGPAGVDPLVKTENIGTDAVAATALGLKNLDRVTDLLIPATTRLGEDYALLEETYKSVLMHRGNWLRSVVQMVGGVTETRALGGRGVESFQRIPRAKQQEAVRFLIEHAFPTPKKLLQSGLVNRFKYLGVADAVMAQQRGLLTNLLSARRFGQLLDAELLNPDEAYTAMQLLNDVQEGVWSELRQDRPVIDVCRRNLQRAYIEHLKNELSGKGGPVLMRTFPVPLDEGMGGGSSGEFRAVARAALKTLAQRLNGALGVTRHDMTRVHLEDCLNEVELILNPKR